MTKCVKHLTFGPVGEGTLVGAMAFHVSMGGDIDIHEALSSMFAKRSKMKVNVAQFWGPFSKENEAAVLTMMSILRDEGIAVVVHYVEPLLWSWSAKASWSVAWVDENADFRVPVNEVMLGPAKKLKEPTLGKVLNARWLNAAGFGKKAIENFLAKAENEWRLACALKDDYEMEVML